MYFAVSLFLRVYVFGPIRQSDAEDDLEFLAIPLEDSLIAYKHALQAFKDMSVATKNKYLIVARVYCQILAAKRLIPAPMSPVKQFQASRRHKKPPLTLEEVNRLINYLNAVQDPFKRARMKALFMLLYAEGLRQIEVCRLDVDDFDAKSKRLAVQGKGQDDKEYIPLRNDTTKALKLYLKLAERKSGSMFYALGGAGRGQVLKPSGIKKIVKEMFERCQIEATTHQLRHTFVNTLLEHYGGDATKVMAYSRHARLDTLYQYVAELDFEKDRNKRNRAAPELKQLAEAGRK